ncbi:hypothetical protein Y032_0099g3163 [Ancylostoma ceylanicum]|uniref:Uncharacterized protein n=1 Tax=Ancylostoma ceylanicum TaxID=53326 RepID=A0A016TIY5_9BILA|nr:hypothetical protein Y032_0099g3163 [Ancylostoma ceylanicum]
MTKLSDITDIRRPIHHVRKGTIAADLIFSVVAKNAGLIPGKSCFIHGHIQDTTAARQVPVAAASIRCATRRSWCYERSEWKCWCAVVTP